MTSLQFVKKTLKIFLLVLMIVLTAIIGYVLITFPPVMAGMAAKTMCSCIFVADRDEQSVREKELKVFPGLSKAGIEVGDSSVAATVLWKTSTAIFRQRLGCTLLSEASEDEVRSQRLIRPQPSFGNMDTVERFMDMLRQDSTVAIDKVRISKALEEAFDESDPERPKNTHAVVIVHRNKIVGEQYAQGFSKNSRHMGWSMTKSITNALVGILIHDGRLAVDAAAPVPEWRNDERSQISLHHLLQASSGLSWSESYFTPTADFHTMFIKRDDKAEYSASKTLKHKPGTFFQYSSGTTNIISRIIRHTVGDSAYHRFPHERLFKPLGITTAVIEPDASGTFVASSYSFASARDWARFGLLFLNDGVWNGERILPEGWVAYSTTPAPAAEMGRYGAHWWLNAGDPDNPANRKYPNLPTDTYWADGFEEQYVMIIPSHDLVIVRLGVSHHGFDISRLAEEVMAAVK